MNSRPPIDASLHSFTLINAGSPGSYVYVAVRTWQTFHVATQIQWCLVCACLTLLEQLYGVSGQLYMAVQNHCNSLFIMFVVLLQFCIFTDHGLSDRFIDVMAFHCTCLLILARHVYMTFNNTHSITQM